MAGAVDAIVAGANGTGDSAAARKAAMEFYGITQGSYRDPHDRKRHETFTTKDGKVFGTYDDAVAYSQSTARQDTGDRTNVNTVIETDDSTKSADEQAEKEEELAEKREEYQEKVADAMKKLADLMKREMEARMKHSIDTVANAIERLANTIETLDTVLEITFEKDYSERLSHISNKLDTTKEKLTDSILEFQRLEYSTDYGYDTVASQISQRMAELAEDILEGNQDLYELSQELVKLRGEAINSISETIYESLEKANTSLEGNFTRLSEGGLGGLKFTSPLNVSKSAVDKQKEINDKLLERQEEFNDVLEEKQQRTIDLILYEELKNINEERASIYKDLEEAKEELEKLEKEVAEGQSENNAKRVENEQKTTDALKTEYDEQEGDVTEHSQSITTTVEELNTSLENTQITAPKLDTSAWDNLLLQVQSYADAIAKAINGVGVPSGGFTGDNNSNSVSPVNTGSVEDNVASILAINGYSPEAIAGIMGNLKSESGFNLSNMQDSYEGKYDDASYTAAVDALIAKYRDSSDEEFAKAVKEFTYDGVGYGLAQWTSSDRKYELFEVARDLGQSISSIEVQSTHLLNELNNGYKKGLNSATTVKEASDYILHWYERPKNQDKLVEDKRYKNALGYYNKYFSTCAKGTSAHPGGVASVGDGNLIKGSKQPAPEIAFYPNGTCEVLGQHGAEFVDLPKGTTVVPADETKKILNRSKHRGSAPYYAEGTEYIETSNNAVKTVINGMITPTVQKDREVEAKQLNTEDLIVNGSLKYDGNGDLVITDVWTNEGLKDVLLTEMSPAMLGEQGMAKRSMVSGGRKYAPLLDPSIIPWSWINKMIDPDGAYWYKNQLDISWVEEHLNEFIRDEEPYLEKYRIALQATGDSRYIEDFDAFIEQAEETQYVVSENYREKWEALEKRSLENEEWMQSIGALRSNSTPNGALDTMARNRLIELLEESVELANTQIKEQYDTAVENRKRLYDYYTWLMDNNGTASEIDQVIQAISKQDEIIEGFEEAYRKNSETYIEYVKSVAENVVKSFGDAASWLERDIEHLERDFENSVRWETRSNNAEKMILLHAEGVRNAREEKEAYHGQAEALRNNEKYDELFGRKFDINSLFTGTETNAKYDALLETLESSEETKPYAELLKEIAQGIKNGNVELSNIDASNKEALAQRDEIVDASDKTITEVDASIEELDKANSDLISEIIYPDWKNQFDVKSEFARVKYPGKDEEEWVPINSVYYKKSENGQVDYNQSPALTKESALASLIPTNDIDEWFDEQTGVFTQAYYDYIEYIKANMNPSEGRGIYDSITGKKLSDSIPSDYFEGTNMYNYLSTLANGNIIKNGYDNDYIEAVESWATEKSKLLQTKANALNTSIDANAEYDKTIGNLANLKQQVEDYLTTLINDEKYSALTSYGINPEDWFDAEGNASAKVAADKEMFAAEGRSDLVLLTDEFVEQMQILKQAYYDAYDDEIEHIDEIKEYLGERWSIDAEILERAHEKQEAFANALEKTYNLQKQIRDEKVSLAAELEASKELEQWLDETTIEDLFNDDDYTKLIEELEAIDEEVQTLYNDYYAEIEALGEDEWYKEAEITAEFERQLEAKMDSYDIAKQELEVTKKTNELRNAMNQRDTRVMTAGGWRIVSDPNKTYEATKAKIEAENNLENLIDDKEKDAFIRNLKALTDATETERQRILRLIELIPEMTDDEVLAWADSTEYKRRIDYSEDKTEVVMPEGGFIEDEALFSGLKAALLDENGNLTDTHKDDVDYKALMQMVAASDEFSDEEKGAINDRLDFLRERKIMATGTMSSEDGSFEINGVKYMPLTQDDLSSLYIGGANWDALTSPNLAQSADFLKMLSSDVNNIKNTQNQIQQMTEIHIGQIALPNVKTPSEFIDALSEYMSQNFDVTKNLN